DPLVSLDEPAMKLALGFVAALDDVLAILLCPLHPLPQPRHTHLQRRRQILRAVALARADGEGAEGGEDGGDFGGETVALDAGLEGVGLHLLQLGAERVAVLLGGIAFGHHVSPRVRQPSRSDMAASLSAIDFLASSRCASSWTRANSASWRAWERKSRAW